MDLKDRVAIVGIGATRPAKGLDQSEEALTCQAILMALADAGLSPADVDGLCSFSIESTDEETVVRNLGIPGLGYFARSPAGGGGGCATLGLAALGLAARQANVVVAWRARKRSQPQQRNWAMTPSRVAGAAMWLRPSGILRPADELALLFRRYMHEFGATRDHLANVAVTIRAHANRNPAAFMHGKPLSREQYHAARWISEPLALYDCCLETDMAQAVVLTRADRARDLRRQPVLIHAFAQGVTADSSVLASCFGKDPLHTQAHICARGLYRSSDFAPADIDVAQIYDSFTPWVLLGLEAYGFCRPGEAGPFTDDGGIGLGGRLPCNTAGGSLSDGYSHGYNHIIEGVRQMRGDSTGQVAGARSCLVTSSDGAPTSAVILRN